jgi:circadian clock protein KaiC
MSATASTLSTLASTGIPGLDQIIGGGLARGHLYLVQGHTGTGKTTLALQFLLAGVRQGERGLYFTLAETAREVQQVAASHGWSIDSNLVHELSASRSASFLTPSPRFVSWPIPRYATGGRSCSCVSICLPWAVQHCS